MTIIFNSLRGDNHIFSMSGIKDGPNFIDYDKYHIGDKIELYWEIPKEVFDGIFDMNWHDIFAHDVWLNGKRFAISLKLVVVEREHGLSFRTGDPINLSMGLSRLTLQPEDWRWEDILQWIFCKKRPTWAGDIDDSCQE